jgi:hypothetical protein
MDITKLMVGQDVFLYGTSGGVWAKVVEVTTKAAIVETARYGAQLIPFDKDGNSFNNPSESLYLNADEAPIHRDNLDPVIFTDEKGLVARFTNRPYKTQNESARPKAAGQLDTTKLAVGKDVFLHGLGSVWAKVISVTPFGVTVETDPFYGAERRQFDKDGNNADHPSKLKLYLFEWNRVGR